MFIPVYLTHRGKKNLKIFFCRFLKNLEETNHLREEINKLKYKVDKLEKSIKTQSTETEQVIESENDSATLLNYEKWYNCSMCDYKVKRKLPLRSTLIQSTVKKTH